MSGGSNIRAIGPDAAQDAQVETTDTAAAEPIELEEEWVEEEFDEPRPARSWSDWLVPGIAIAAILGWSGVFGWAFQQDILAGGTPQQWVGWVINWSVPVLLITSLWMLAMRLSRREATRFGDAAFLLRQEADALENRLAVVNRELSLAREFLGSQSRELDSLGRIASERLAKHASELQSLIHSNGAQVEAIATVSDSALSNMGKLRDDLPVIATSARDVSNQIGQAGRTAHDQIDKLVSGFERLNAFGKASGDQIHALSEQVETTLAQFETQLGNVEEMAQTRFAALAEQSEAFRVELDGREVNALAAMRTRAEELRGSLANLSEEFEQHEDTRIEAFRSQIAAVRDEIQVASAALDQAQHDAVGMLDTHRDRLYTDLAKVVGKIDQLDQHAVAAGRRRVDAFEQEAAEFETKFAARDAKFAENMARMQDEFETRETQASEILAQRLAELDEMLAERTEAQLKQLEKLVGQGTAVSAKVDELNKLIATVNEQSQTAQETLGHGLGDISGKLESSRTELAATGATLNELTEAGIRLLEIIQSGARESREALPSAIEKAASKLSDVEQRAVMLKDTVEAAHERSSGLSDYVISAKQTLEEADANLTALTARLNETTDESLARVTGLRGALRDLEQESERVSSRTGEELRSAIVQLEEAARHAFAAIESGANDRLGELAREISAKAGSAIEESLRAEGAHAVERIEQANLRASDSGRETVAALRDQLAKVNELAQNLEQRVARARAQAQEQVDNDFARRMALITESLNSNAIDIAKGLSQDVTDTAWASYLKGDRGIFTRRAVRLVDNAEAREIMDLYEVDDTFREHVSRYIHDFESMLRTVLSTRDGNALGVTLLSSDMGKLYVALAQSIERLRD